MPDLHRPLLAALASAAVALASSLAAGTAAAQRADRAKPMVIEADKPGVVDLQRQVVTFNGNVTIAQGTMNIRAERVEIREAADGYRVASASGGAGKPASFRQKRELRDGSDESVEGHADRIEYDQKADTLRFSGNAAVRRLRGAVVADEIVGGSITWNASAEVFSVEGGAVTPTNPSGRVRAVLSPRAEPASAPAGATRTAPLKPSKTLGEPK